MSLNVGIHNAYNLYNMTIHRGNFTKEINKS